MTRTSDSAYLFMVFGYDSKDVELFLSTTSMPIATAGWLSMGAWLIGFSPKYQNIRLNTKRNSQLFAFGTNQSSDGEDCADLYRVMVNASTYKPTFAKVAIRHMYCKTANTRNTRCCDFRAGGGPFIDSTGHIILYGIEHYDDAYPGAGCGVKVRES